MRTPGGRGTGETSRRTTLSGGLQVGRFRSGRIAAIGTIIALASAGTALAFQALPPGAQVNDDTAAGIETTRSVSGADPTNADVVGGALTAGKVAVPWATFQQQASTGFDQIFARSFAGGAWTTRGSGTVNGRSSASPKFSGSLNFSQDTDGEVPAIDFAGAGRTVPWATWYEHTIGAGFEKDNIFASRFDNTGDANQGKWIFGGQSRGTGGGSVPVPSLNIHTNQDAQNPSVAGGSAVDPTSPAPWVAWQETTPIGGKDQIFVVRPIGPGAANCNGVTPAGVMEGGSVPAIGGFCWQQTGVPRVGAGPDPTLNVDPTRNGIEPDIEFTGAADGVPWVVWYETGASGIGLHGNEMVFAAKGVKDETPGNGGFHWVAVGNQLSATLDTSGATNKFGSCAESTTNEAQCSLNRNPNENAENVRVAAGTMNPANPTVPWATWDESVAGVRQVFVSRLVGTGAEAHFEIANGGAPISSGANDSTRPDITFSGNTPYVSWREDVGGGVEKAFLGHLVNAAAPTFVADESDVPLTPKTQADVREPISSSCIATPFNSDGASCQGGALGTPFFLFTNGASPSPLGLFADAYQPDAPVTGGPSAVSTSTAVLSGAVNPRGASVNVFFEFGTTPAYGQTTAPQRTAANESTTPFAASLAGLPAGTVIHYRAVAASDFGSVTGGDQTLTTASVPPAAKPITLLPVTLANGSSSLSHPKISGTTASVRVSCKGPSGSKCRLLFKLTVTETFKGHRLIAVSARSKLKKKTVVLGTASVTLNAGTSRTVRVALNAVGKRLLAKRHKLSVKLSVSQILANGKSKAIQSPTVSFKAAKKRHH
jgi:hypothetical protein